jgi:hypothetical protein
MITSAWSEKMRRERLGTLLVKALVIRRQVRKRVRQSGPTADEAQTGFLATRKPLLRFALSGVMP